MFLRCLVVCLLAASVPCDAIGFMFTGAGGRGDLMEITSVEATVDIHDRLSVTRVDQVFRNPHNAILEGVYEFVLPRGAVITDLVLWVGDRRVQGTIVEKEQGRQVYEDIVSRQIDPALVEQVAEDRFRLSVFPFEALGSRRVELEYMQLLDAREGLQKYVFPLAAETQQPVSVGLLTLRVDVDSQVDFTIETTDFFQSATTVDRPDKRGAVITFADEDVVASLDYTVSILEQLSTEPRAISHGPSEQSPGYYAMWLPPVQDLLASGPVPRAVSFVVDISSSMRDGRLETVQSALSATILGLAPDDLFNVVVFNSTSESFRQELVPASTANLQEAVDFIRIQGPLGATSFEAALRAALEVPAPGRAHHIVFLTDGVPTVGLQDLSDLDALSQAYSGVRIFTIGVGDGVDRAFLRSLANGRNGQAGFVADQMEAEDQLRQLFEEFSNPTMTIASVEMIGSAVSDLIPRDVALVSAGEELFQVGRYDAGGDVTVRVSGHMLDRDVVLDYPMTLAAQGTSLAIVPRLWAQRKVEAIESQLDRLGHNTELLDDILHLGLTYRLVTGRTSLFAPDPEVVLNPSLERDATSASAVGEQEPEHLAWLGRDFTLRADTWVDEWYRTSMPVVEILASEETDLPFVLTEFAALGPRVLVTHSGTAYLLIDDDSSASVVPRLGPNAPNPFNAGTMIPYYLPAGRGLTSVRLEIYSITGQRLWAADPGAILGSGSVYWDGRDSAGRPAATGVYLVRLVADDHVEYRRILLAR
jgi:Ca-activated chloride channel homolog